MRALDDIVERVPVRTYLRIRTLPDDDCIIDHNTEHNDKTEQAHRIDRDRPGRHQPQCAKEANRQSHDDPERDFHPQEQRQHDKHEYRADHDIALTCGRGCPSRYFGRSIQVSILTPSGNSARLFSMYP